MNVSTYCLGKLSAFYDTVLAPFGRCIYAGARWFGRTVCRIICPCLTAKAVDNLRNNLRTNISPAVVPSNSRFVPKVGYVTSNPVGSQPTTSGQAPSTNGSSALTNGPSVAPSEAESKVKASDVDSQITFKDKGNGEFEFCSNSDGVEALTKLMERLQAELKSRNLSDRAVYCTVEMADITKFGSFNPIYKSSFNENSIPARAAYSVDLPQGDRVRVTVKTVAKADQLVFMRPEKSPYPFSAAVRVDKMLYLSGDLGLDYSKTPPTLVTGGVEKETEQTLKNIKAKLEYVGIESLARKLSMTSADTFNWTVVLVNETEEAAFRQIFDQFISDHKNSLAPNQRLNPPIIAKALAFGARVEVLCTVNLS